MELVGEDDILILTADHGCDPSWQGTDHTREHIPVLVYGPKVKPGSLGHRETFADIGQTGEILWYVRHGIWQGHVLRSLPGGAMLTGPVVCRPGKAPPPPGKTTI